jgi:hypothetical protein
MNAPRRRLPGHSPLPEYPIQTKHHQFIGSLPCLRCGKPAPSECAYVGMLPGLGILPSDRYFVPLCGPATVWHDCCHSRKHYRGAARFWAELGIDPIDLAFQLWRVSGDVTAGLRAMARARQAAARQHRNLQDTKESSWRSAVDHRPALRHRLRPTAMATRPISSEFAWFVESRS